MNAWWNILVKHFKIGYIFGIQETSCAVFTHYFSIFFPLINVLVHVEIEWGGHSLDKKYNMGFYIPKIFTGLFHQAWTSYFWRVISYYSILKVAGWWCPSMPPILHNWLPFCTHTHSTRAHSMHLTYDSDYHVIE